MRHLWKGMMVVTVCMVLVFGLCKPVHAQGASGALPRYVSLMDCKAFLSLSGEDTVSVSAKVQGKDGVSATSMVAILQRQRGSNWVNVRTWEKSSTSNSVTLQENYPVSSGSYRVKLTGTADGESVTVYSSTLTY